MLVQFQIACRVVCLVFLLGGVTPTFAEPVKQSTNSHWSFEPVTRPTPPKTANHRWPQTELDRFILARLEKEGLRPSTEADRVSWLRRVSFDLVGLPPSPEQVETFVR